MTTEIVSAKLTETRIQTFQTSLQPSAFAFTLDSRLRGNDDLVTLIRYAEAFNGVKASADAGVVAERGAIKLTLRDLDLEEISAIDRLHLSQARIVCTS